MANLKLCIAKFSTQEFDQTNIFLDREDTRATQQNLFGQSTQAGTNLENKIIRLDFSLSDDPTRKVPVVQKILAKCLDRSHARFFQGRSELRRVHPRPETRSSKARNLFTKICEQIAGQRQRLYTSYSHN